MGSISERMSRQATRDTAPELLLRRRLHALGLRYRIHFQPVTGVRRTADIVFLRQRVAVFVDGCFWHGCPEHGTAPKTNAEWWASKLARNIERDADTDRRFADAGWIVVRIWEHEAAESAAARVAGTLQTHEVHRKARELYGNESQRALHPPGCSPSPDPALDHREAEQHEHASASS